MCAVHHRTWFQLVNVTASGQQVLQCIIVRGLQLVNVTASGQQVLQCIIVRGLQLVNVAAHLLCLIAILTYEPLVLFNLVVFSLKSPCDVVLHTPASTPLTIYIWYCCS